MKKIALIILFALYCFKPSPIAAQIPTGTGNFSQDIQAQFLPILKIVGLFVGTGGQCSPANITPNPSVSASSILDTPTPTEQPTSIPSPSQPQPSSRISPTPSRISPTSSRISSAPQPSRASSPSPRPPSSAPPSIPSGTGGIFVTKARELLSIFQNKCPDSSSPPIIAFATKTNGCYAKIQNEDIIKNTQAGYEISRSITSFDFLQCVGFVKAVTAAAGHPWDKNFVSSNGAKGYAKMLPPGFVYIPNGNGQIQPGDFVIWNSSTPEGSGHIAVVVSVTSDGKQFEVAEANIGKEGSLAIRAKKVNNSILGWYRLK